MPVNCGGRGEGALAARQSGQSVIELAGSGYGGSAPNLQDLQGAAPAAAARGGAVARGGAFAVSRARGGAAGARSEDRIGTGPPRARVQTRAPAAGSAGTSESRLTTMGRGSQPSHLVATTSASNPRRIASSLRGGSGAAGAGGGDRGDQTETSQKGRPNGDKPRLGGGMGEDGAWEHASAGDMLSQLRGVSLGRR